VGEGGTFRGIIEVVSLKKLKMRLVGMNKSGLAAAGSEAEVELSGAALQRLKSKKSQMIHEMQKMFMPCFTIY
jgi:hypothetical protein